MKYQFSIPDLLPHIDLSSRQALPRVFSYLGLTGNGCEVGVQRGEYAQFIRENWQGNLHLIDRWQHADGYQDIANVSEQEQLAFYQHVQEVFKGRSDVFIHKASSPEASSLFPDNFFDWVYLDADHSYSAVVADILAWYPKVRAGGILAGHDYCDGVLPEGDFGVKSAVDQTIAQVGRKLYVTGEPRFASWFFVK